MFIVYGLPRSRTFWLSRWLSSTNCLVGHDTGIETDTCQQLIDVLSEMGGSVETGSMFAHRIFAETWPKARFATVRRPLTQVGESLRRLGIVGLDEELQRRDEHLDAIESMGAKRVEYQSLADAQCCSDLYEYLCDAPFDFRNWQKYASENIQLDIPSRMSRLSYRKEQIDALKAEAANIMAASGNYRLVAVSWESFSACADEAVALGAKHSREVNAGERYGHPYKPNVALLSSLERTGAFRFMSARFRGELVGYIMWTFFPDVESDGVLIADQGPWFVRDDPALRSLHIGRRMLDKAIKDLKASGFHSIQLHHQLAGRGKSLGKMFARMGAVEHQHRYTLWIGDKDA